MRIDIINFSGKWLVKVNGLARLFHEKKEAERFAKLLEKDPSPIDDMHPFPGIARCKRCGSQFNFFPNLVNSTTANNVSYPLCPNCGSFKDTTTAKEQNGWRRWPAKE